MGHVQILDCTLRDGAYLLDKRVGDENIHGIIRGLMEAKIDWIEVGFLQNSGGGEGNVVFRNGQDARRYIPADKGGCRFAVLADYSRYEVELLDENTGTSFDAVRACFFKEEYQEAVPFCRAVKEKGYQLFMQPVDILGYSDEELLALIGMANGLEPDCFAIVDTFGSMYEDDLQRVFALIDHNLAPSCKVAFHSHNNLQMSSALAQSFIRMSLGRREVVVDTTISGMGRGAGNTPTELIVQYLVSKWGYHYQIDALLDLIDTNIDNLKTRCSWGYSASIFIAGAYGAHVNNVSYLLKKNSIRSKDIRHILERVGEKVKRYDYGCLEKAYLEYIASDMDDSQALKELHQMLAGRSILIVAPGNSILHQMDRMEGYLEQKQAVVISINFIPQKLPVSFLYVSNARRYYSREMSWSQADVRKIITSNIRAPGREGEYVISLGRLVKCGWEYMENSAIMLLRLLDLLDVEEVGIAGLDGYSSRRVDRNYAGDSLETLRPIGDSERVNGEISQMLADFVACKRSAMRISFVTSSRFEGCLEERKWQKSYPS